MELKHTIEQRKTIKAFNSTIKISRTELEEMVALSQLAPQKQICNLGVLSLLMMKFLKQHYQKMLPLMAHLVKQRLLLW